MREPIELCKLEAADDGRRRRALSGIGSPLNRSGVVGGPGSQATVSVLGATARDFTDDGLILTQVDTRYLATAPQIRQDIGDVQPLAYRTVRRYLTTFFDVQLRNLRPAPAAPEPGVTVQMATP